MHLFWRGLSGEIVKTPLPFNLPLTNVPSKSYLEYDMKYEDVHDILLEKIEWTKNSMTQNVYRNYKKIINKEFYCSKTNLLMIIIMLQLSAEYS